MRHLLAFCCLILVISCGVMTHARAEDDGVLKVGVREIPPFVIQDDQGNWTGVGVEVWRQAANENGFKFKFVPMDREELHEALVSGQVDVGIADMAVNREHEELMSFSHTYFHSRQAIASRAEKGSSLFHVLETLSSPTTLSVLGIMLVMMLVAATIFWLVEKHSNADLYDPKHRKLNFFNGVIWTLLLITAQESDVFKNKSFFGRIVAILLLVVGVTVSASYIAVITSAVTVSQMNVAEVNEDDLPFMRIGALRDTHGHVYLEREHLKHVLFDDMHKLMDALKNHKVDAVIADEVELQYYSRRHGDHPIVILPTRLRPEYHALAFPEGSSLPNLVNPAILGYVDSPAWRDLLDRYVGRQS